MPSAFEQQFASAVDALYEGAFGLAASYQAPDGSAAVAIGDDGNPLVIRLHREPAMQLPRPSGAAGERQGGQIEVRAAQLAKVVAHGRFTVEGVEVWTVETTPVLKNGQHYCAVTRAGVDGLMQRRAKG